MKKIFGLAAALGAVALLLCACELGSPAPSAEPTATEHIHEAVNRGNDENQHYDICSCGDAINIDFIFFPSPVFLHTYLKAISILLPFPLPFF